VVCARVSTQEGGGEEDPNNAGSDEDYDYADINDDALDQMDAQEDDAALKVCCCAVLLCCCAVLVWVCGAVWGCVLCCAVLCCAVLCFAVLYCAVLCCVVLWCACVLWCAVLCCDGRMKERSRFAVWVG
jgi:hypothetical protein